MGDPRKLRKKYEAPAQPWEKTRIEEENKLQSEFGLKNKKEIWKAKAQLKKYRKQARELVGVTQEERMEKETILLTKLQKIGILKPEAVLDDILSLKVEDLLSRRLQTIVWKKGIAGTASQARQFIIHGHISLEGRKVNAPSMIIELEKEKELNWYGKPIEIQLPKTETTIEELADVAKKDKESTELEKEAATIIIDKQEAIDEKKEEKETKEAIEVAEEIIEEKGKSGLEKVSEEVTPDKGEKKTTTEVKKAIKKEEKKTPASKKKPGTPASKKKPGSE